MATGARDPEVLRRFEQLWRWRRAAAWAPVVWFPLVVARLLMEAPLQALALGLAGLVFAGLARMVLWGARCPACQAPFRSTPEGVRRIWEDAACGACGCSLFALRRACARD